MVVFLACGSAVKQLSVQGEYYGDRARSMVLREWIQPMPGLPQPGDRAVVQRIMTVFAVYKRFRP